MTTKINEKKFMDFFEKNKIVVFSIIITAISLLLRIKMIGFESDDYRDFLNPWFNQIKQMRRTICVKKSNWRL